MALEEVSFINLLGDEVSITNIVEQMIDFYQQKLDVGDTRVTDFNEGSEIRNFLEAVAVLGFNLLEDVNEATKLPFISSSYGTGLDQIGANPFIALERIIGEYSVGSVTFTLVDEQEDDFIIPVDTLLETADGLMFSTDADCTIFAGETTGDVGVTCLSEGYDGNIPSNTLTIISDGDIDSTLLSVTNPDAFIGGSDLEDDEDYRTRLLENVRAEGFGTLPYYESLGESVDGVHDVSFVNASGYTRKVLVNGYSKPTPDSVLLDVLAEYSDVEKKILNHTFTVDKPSYTTVAFTFTLNVTREFTNTELTSFITALVYGGAYEQMEFTGLSIGEDLTHQLFDEGFGLLDEVVSMSVSVTGQSSEFTSTSITSGQVVQLGTLTFNQTVV